MKTAMGMAAAAAGLFAGAAARTRDAGRELVRVLTAPAAAPVIKKHGREPA